MGSSSDDAPNGFTEANGGLPDDTRALFGADDASVVATLLLSVLALNTVVVCDFPDNPKLKGVLTAPAEDDADPSVLPTVGLLNAALKVKGLTEL